jgi:hypothetical protein
VGCNGLAAHGSAARVHDHSACLAVFEFDSSQGSAAEGWCGCGGIGGNGCRGTDAPGSSSTIYRIIGTDDDDGVHAADASGAEQQPPGATGAAAFAHVNGPAQLVAPPLEPEPELRADGAVIGGLFLSVPQEGLGICQAGTEQWQRFEHAFRADVAAALSTAAAGATQSTTPSATEWVMADQLLLLGCVEISAYHLRKISMATEILD